MEWISKDKDRNQLNKISKVNKRLMGLEKHEEE